MPQQRLNCKTGLKFKLTIGGDDVRVERGGETQAGVMSGKKKTTRNRAGSAEERRCRCGRKADCGGEQETRKDNADIEQWQDHLQFNTKTVNSVDKSVQRYIK